MQQSHKTKTNHKINWQEFGISLFKLMIFIFILLFGFFIYKYSNNKPKYDYSKLYNYTVIPIKDSIHNSIKIYEYTIDGCQYIGNICQLGEFNYLTHKGNCTNSIHGFAIKVK